VAVGLAARGAHAWLPPELGRVVGEVIFAVLLGLLVGNAAPLPAATGPGIRFACESLLRLAIVLLGAGFSFLAAVAIGAKALLMIVALMLLALGVAHALGRLAGVPGKLATLIGVGTAVCGNSAIGAAAPVIGARDEDVAFAIATNTLFGTLAVFAYPILGHALGMSDAAFGTWAGTAVNDTSQVVATGFAYGDTAGRVATVVKLTRNALMGVVIVALGLVYGRAGAGTGMPLFARLRRSVPWFVVGFLLLAMLETVGVFAALSAWTGADVQGNLQRAARLLILFALAGVGLGTRFAALRRTGIRPLYVGLATALGTCAASYLLIALFGPAGE
jgi:uncharacterized integral membrane protein (TIGR00698 family)